MEEKLVHKFIIKVKDKLSKNKTSYPSVSEYAFSSEEIESINQQNKQKIHELKQDSFSLKREEKKEREFSKKQVDEEILSPIETSPVIEAVVDRKAIQDYQDQMELLEDKNLGTVLDNHSKELESNFIEDDENVKKLEKHSFIHLNSEHQKLVMEKWNEIDSNQIDKDIMAGKELLNHNYTITYPDDASRYIHHIRKCYEVVICYLIGFNNEKKGIYETTIFSSRMEDEWKYLNQYIKVLEKIRSFKK
ncbi:MAG: hypothetical protein MR598_03680 [Erysipelotrichaceae bacterium]|nr:hypothetical protein [Erysipelotrichaceae bacterium]